MDVHGDELGQTLLGGLDLKEGEDGEPLIGFAFPFRCLLKSKIYCSCILFGRGYYCDSYDF